MNMNNEYFVNRYVPNAKARKVLLDHLQGLDSENKKLRQILIEVLEACDNGAWAAQDASLDFLSLAPSEVKLVLARIKREKGKQQ